MKGYLEELEIFNFKSYSGTTLIKFLPFTAIVGPNGSGKSNLMDAICFVLGEKTSNLRGNKVSDLIYGANVGLPSAHTARVSATYSNEDGSKSRFMRIVKGSTTEYKVNDSVVSSIEYKRAIQNINVFVKQKNFLVYQGEVPNIATKSSKDITKLVEEISGSISYKEEYEKLKLEMEKAEVEVMSAHQIMKDLRLDRKRVKTQERKDRERENMIDEYDRDTIELSLMELYYNNKFIEKIKGIDKDLKKESIDMKLKINPLEADLKTEKKLQGKSLRQVTVMEKKLNAIDAERNEKTTTYIKSKQVTAANAAKAVALNKQVDKIKAGLEKRNETKKDLEQQIQTIKDGIAKEDDEVQKLSTSKVLGLNKRQEKEYNSLQQTLNQRAMLTENEIEKIESELITSQENINALQREQTNILLTHNQAELELTEQTTRANRLKQDVANYETNVNDLRSKVDELKRLNPAETIRTINSELEELQMQENDIKISELEKKKEEKKREVIQRLKEKFPGVLGRLSEFCTPSHTRYELAIARVLGKHMSSIVCDKQATAQECIQYMKEQRMERETFLAYDYLTVKPTNLSLREIRSPPGVKLAIDIVRYDKNNTAVHTAVQFACKDTLVCETVDDARVVAFGQSTRRQAVSLDGTLLAKNGRITGGAESLRQKAKPFSMKALDKIHERRSELKEQLKTACKERRSEFDIKDFEVQIAGFENRKRFAIQDISRAEARITVLNQAVEEKKIELDNFVPRIEEIKEIVQRLNERKDDLHSSLNPLWEEVFSRFCNKHNLDIDEIRKLPSLSDERIKVQKRRLDLANQESRLKNQIEYESVKIREEYNKLDDREEECASVINKQEESKKQEMKAAEDLRVVTEKIDKVKDEKESLKTDIRHSENKVKEIKKQIADIKKEHDKLLAKITSIELELLKGKEERHLLYQGCRMNAIDIQLVQGSLHGGSSHGAGDGEGSSSASEAMGLTQANAATYEKEDEIIVDFEHLSDELKSIEQPMEIQKTVQDWKAKLANKKHIVNNMIVYGSKGEVVNEKFKHAKETMDERTNTVKAIKQQFEEVKKKRYTAFTDCSNFLTTEVDKIYKKITQNPAAQADLYPDNTEEPYLDGLRYFCVAPGKRYLNMEDLSGGEKTVVALALLFAIHAYKPSPFFVVDEIDAALDNTNIGKVVNFLKLLSQEVQCIIISLKQELYSEADALIGVYSQKIGRQKCSGVLSVEL